MENQHMLQLLLDHLLRLDLLLQLLLELDLKELIILFHLEKMYDNLLLLHLLQLFLEFLLKVNHLLLQQQLNNLLDLDQILVMCKFLMM
jgi:hypothetical protein